MAFIIGLFIGVFIGAAMMISHFDRKIIDGVTIVVNGVDYRAKQVKHAETESL